ncbi:MAG: hypothetical protein ACOX17_04670 [Christensenellales bacterium]|jgi:hypothetical protein
MKQCRDCNLYFNDIANRCAGCGAALLPELTAAHSGRPLRPADVGSPIPWLVLNIALTCAGCLPFGIPGIVAASKALLANARCHYDRVRVCNAKAKKMFFWGVGVTAAFWTLLVIAVILGLWGFAEWGGG